MQKDRLHLRGLMMLSLKRLKRRAMINKIADVLEGCGFVPLETPTIEFAETLLGKYEKKKS